MEAGGTHVSRGQLELMAKGRLSPQERRRIVGHLLSGCEPCLDLARLSWGAPEGHGHDRGRESRLSSRPPLPPNRTCGSPASGSPVGGFTSGRIDGPEHRL